MIQRSKTGAVDVLRIAAPLDASSRQGVQDALAACLLGGRPMAVLDLSEVDLMDSVGLEEIVDQQRAFLHHGGELKLAEASPLCADILRITGISEQMELHDSVKEAVSSFLR